MQSFSIHIKQRIQSKWFQATISLQLTALADTGCQAVCMGRTQLQSLGLSVSDLLTPILNLKAANDTGITVLGAVFLYLSGKDKLGKEWGTHQVCYVAEGLNQILLSRQACEQLGMISPSFPTVGCQISR